MGLALGSGGCVQLYIYYYEKMRVWLGGDGDGVVDIVLFDVYLFLVYMRS